MFLVFRSSLTFFVLSSSFFVLHGRPAPLHTQRSPGTVETLRSTGGLPPATCNAFREPLGLQQIPGGTYFVFDKRAHSVYSVDADRTTFRKVVDIVNSLAQDHLTNKAPARPPPTGRSAAPARVRA